MVVKIITYWFRGEKIVVDLCDTEEQLKSVTGWQLKHKIVTSFPSEGWNLDLVRIFFCDKVIEDDRPLSSYGIQHMSVVHTVMKVPGGGPLKEDGGMGDKKGKNRSMERLSFF